MALRWLDSFQHYATADIAAKYTSTTGTVGIVAAVGRRGGSTLRAPNNTSVASSVTKTIDAQGTWTVGAALKILRNPAGASAIALIALLDAGTLQVDLRINGDETLSVTRNGTVLGTTTARFGIGYYQYLELKVVISDTVGTVEVRIDGTSVLSLSSQDTKNTANATANQIRVGTGAAATVTTTLTWGDLYICDGTGGVNDTFLGDIRVDAFLPSGNGNSSQLAGSDGNSTDNYLLADESTPNGDTDYLSSATIGNKDTYAFSDISYTPTAIVGIQTVLSAKIDSGARSLAACVRSGGTDYDGATVALTTSYVFYPEIRQVDPATALAWTKTNFNAIEMGSKVAA